MRAGDERLQRLDVRDRQVRIDGAHGFTDGPGESGRVRRANDEAHRRRHGFPAADPAAPRVVRHLRRILVEPQLVHVVHDADDARPGLALLRVRRAGRPDPLADGALARPVRFRQRPRDDHDGRIPPRVQRLELAPVEHVDLHRAEEAGGDLLDHEDVRDVVVLRRPSLDTVAGGLRRPPEGQRGSRRGCRPPRQGGEAFDHRAMEVEARRRRFVLARRQRNPEVQDVGRIEPGIDGGDPLVRPDRETGPDEQRQREGDLRHHEPPPQELAPAAAGDGARPFRHPRRRRRQGGRADRRQQAEQEAGGHRDREAEQQHGAIHRHFRQARQVPGTEADYETHGGPRERQRQQPAADTEHDALEQQRPREAPARLPQRGADRQLPRACFRADQKEVGDVRAGNQQEESDRAQQDPERRSDVAHDELARRAHERAQAGVRQERRRRLIRKRLRQIRQHRFEFRLHLRQRGVRRQPPDALRAERTQLKRGAVDAKRPPQFRVGLGRHDESGGHDAHQFDTVAVDVDDSADHVRIAAEPPPPEVIAENRDPPRIAAFVVHREGPAEPRPGSRHVEERRGNARAAHPFRVPRAGEAGRSPLDHRDALERPALLLVAHVERVGDGELVELGQGRRGMLQHDEAFGVGKRQRPEQHGVDDREDGDVGAHADRQREERDRREAGRGGEAPDENAERPHDESYLRSVRSTYA